MFKKITKLVIVAFVAVTTTALPLSEQLNPLIKLSATADYPLPNMPLDFEARADAYTWKEGMLEDDDFWGETKFSSKLNMIYDGQGRSNDRGEDYATDIKVSKGNEKVSTEYI